jgi:RHS repeat-associated protein
MKIEVKNGEYILINTNIYSAEVLAAYNYYPFGMLQPGMYAENNDKRYRFGFNGMLRDDDVMDKRNTPPDEGRGNSYDFGARMYNPRVTRFFSLDPKRNETANESPYIFAGNEPIRAIDLNGEKKFYVITLDVKVDADGNYSTSQYSPGYETKDDGKLPFRTEIKTQYQFGGKFYDDEMKVPGYAFWFHSKVDPNRKIVGDALMIVGGVATFGLATSALIAAKTATQVVVASLGLLTSSVQFASGSIKLALDIKGNYALSEKLPGGYMETFGFSLDLMIGNEKHTLQGGFKLVEGLVLWRPHDIPKNAPDWLKYGINAYSILNTESVDYLQNVLKESKDD